MVSLDWEILGEGEHTACLVHPLGMDRGFWQWLRADLSHRLRWLVVDLPGHGSSPLPEGAYSIEEVAQSVSDIIGESGAGPMTVIGSSFGGMVALALGARYPQAANGLVLADCTARYEDGFGWSERAATVRGSGMSVIVEATLQRWFSSDALDRASPQIDYVRKRLTEVDPEGYALACEALGAADLTAMVADVTLRSLVIAGSDDVLVEDCRWLAATLPNASLSVLPGGKHGAPIECRQGFTAAVTQFLDE